MQKSASYYLDCCLTVVAMGLADNLKEGWRDACKLDCQLDDSFGGARNECIDRNVSERFSSGLEWIMIYSFAS